MWNLLVLVITHLKWAFDFLLSYSFSVSCGHNSSFIPKTSAEILSIKRYEGRNSGESGEENVECAVCLCKIEEGEEIGELRCCHIFHEACLYRWMDFNQTTCPLCRSSLAPPPPPAEFGVEVLFFKFCSFSSEDDDRDMWWLR
ncbi:hypothetical protein UlMin_040947 [Ulmus minor]